MFYYTYIKYELKGNNMVIRTLKTALLTVTFIIFILNASIINTVNTQDQPVDTIDIAADTDAIPISINTLNTLIKSSSENLDKINSVLEFMAQAINRGSIVLKNRDAAKKWVKNNQDNIKILENSLNEFDIDIAKIYKVNCVSKFLIAHIQNQLEQQLHNLQGFGIDLDAMKFTRSQLSKITPKFTQQLIRTNLKQVLGLQEKANEIGLTSINKATRKIEHINDKYRITRLLSIAPPVLLLSIATLYYIPLSWFKTDKKPATGWFSKIPGLSKLKSIKKYWVGCAKQTDGAVYSENRTKGNGLLHIILSIWEKDSVKLSLILSALIAYANKDSFSSTFPSLEKFLSATRNFWQRLKGYEVKNSSRYEIIENLTLDDERIIGLDDQKEELHRTLEYLANPEMYDKQQSGPGKAIIIVGPSGNGKTLLAKAAAGSANALLKNKGSNNRIAFKEIKWAEVAWTKEGMKKIVQEAQPHAPCMLFFDEIHTLPLQTKEGSPTLSDLLTELDGVNTANSASNQIIFVAATNQPEMLDSALLRSGRFGTIITVKKPNFEARKKYFEVMCKRYSIDTTNIDLDLIARQTTRCSYSDLDSILKDARFMARREMRSTNQKHIQDRIIKRTYRIKDASALSDFEKKYLSANKAGSALMFLLLDPQEKLEIVTIKGRWKKIKESRYWDNEARKQMATSKNIKYGAIFTYNPNEELNLVDENEKIKQCKIKMAGYLAEEVLLKSRSSKAANKHETSSYQKNKKKAFELIKSMLYETFEDDFMSKKMKQELKEKTYELFKQHEQEVKDLLIHNYSLLEKICSELQDKELLTEAQLQHLMTNV